MSTDDREQLEMDAIERILGRILRRDIRLQDEDCPLPEQLAAYHEQALSAAGKDRLEAHLSNCWRCQDTLAALAISEPPELQPAVEEFPAEELTVAAAPAVSPAPPTVAADFLPVPSELHEPAPAPAAAAAPVPAPAVREPALRKPPKKNVALAWRWLAPAAALAGLAVLGFIAGKMLHRPALVATPSTSVVSPEPAARLQEQNQIAKNLATPPPSSTLPGMESLAKKSPVLERSAKAGAGKLKATAGPPRKAAIPSSTQADLNASASARLGIPTDKSAEKQSGETKQTLAAKKAPAPSPPPSVTATVAVSGAGQAAVGGALAGRAPSAMTPAGARAQMLTRERAAGSPDAAASEYSTEGRIRETEALSKTAGAAGTLLTVTALSDPAVRWRFGPAGHVERSIDAGANWQTQFSGVTANLTSGSAPTARICWLAGASGAILRTTDGEHWETIPSPAPLDWTRIFAVDAQQAVITSSDGKRYVTNDGGRTWEVASK